MTEDAPQTLEGWPTALSRRFAPGAQLGRGNFGTVFAAIDLTRGARVAVKVLRADRLTGLQAFKREFRALTDLAHDHLVPLHELGREGDTWFLVMEVIDGLELNAALVARPAQLRSVFAQISLGLSFLHASGRLHRDLKPSNVRVTPEGRAVLLDFGLAVDGPPDATEGPVGAAAWLSPEQAAGADASPASDLYALGVMLFEALAGRRPFEGRALEVLAAKRARDAVELPDAPPEIRALCARLLSRDPAQRPTAADVVCILDASLVPLLAQRPEAPLIGREALVAQLEEAAREETATAVWLQGAPGLGKSALLRHFLAGRQQAGALVLSSRCFEHESTPFKAVDGLVDGLARWLTHRRGAPLSAGLKLHAANLARSFPALRSVTDTPPSDTPPELHRTEAAIAFRALLTFAAREQRVVVAIDDLHWADADSVPFLRELLDTREPPTVLFVGALRDEGHTLLDPLRRAPGPAGCATRRELRLTPLTEADAHHLVRTLVPDLHDTQALVTEAAGNPFLLQALAGHEGNLHDAVAARLARLPESARRLLEVVCLAGAPLERLAWSTAATLAHEDALALGHLRAGRLVRVRGDGALEPYHDTLRRAVAERLPHEHRQQHHTRLAAALETTGADPQLLALHLHAAGRVEEAATHALRGAQRAMSALAFHHAAELFAKVLQWAPHRADGRVVKRSLGEALSNTGRGEDAARALLEACDGASHTEALELRTRAGAQLLRTGRLERGLELTREVLEARGLSLAKSPQGALASLVWTRARLRLRGYAFEPRDTASLPADELARVDALTSASIGLAAVDSLRAADLMGQALLRALRLGDPARIAVCLGFETAFAGNAGGAGEERTMKVLEAADVLTRSLGDTYARACALGGAGIARFHLGHLDDAKGQCEQAAQLFELCPGAVKELFTIRLFGLAALAQAGEFGELSRRLEDGLRLATERGDRYAEANLRVGLNNLAWLALDDEARARHELDAARPGLNTTGYSVQHFFELMGRFNVELYADDARAAERLFVAGLPALERSLMSRTEWIALYAAWMKGRVLLATRTASLGKVLRHVETIERRQRPWGDVLALGLRAAVHRAEGDVAQAARVLATSASRSDACGLKLHAACSRLAHANLVGDAVAADTAQAAAKALGVTDLARMSRVFLPGLTS